MMPEASNRLEINGGQNGATDKSTRDFMQMIASELRRQRQMAFPLVAMNFTWFAKLTITTAFLGQLGELQLAGGALGLTFANVTGLSVLYGLCAAMEPICGQAFGAKNFQLLHKTFVMTIILLLMASFPIAFLWLNVHRILSHFSQQDISFVAWTYLLYLLPHLVVTSFLCPLKAYLSAQGITIPIMFSSALALAMHIPLNILLAEAKGIKGVSMAVWISDLVVVILLAAYVFVLETGKEANWKGGWWDHGIYDWLRLLKLCGPCCLTTCLEWWCYEILVLLTGRLPNPTQAVGILAIVLNYDYLLYSVMVSLATCASTRVSNELGANRPGTAYHSAYISLVVSVVLGCIGGLVTVGSKNVWGSLFSHDEGIIKGVKRIMLLIALMEVLNFPFMVCGGVIRGTARPWLAMYANLGGFYLLSLPAGVVLAFKAKRNLSGLLEGFLIGLVVCLVMLLVFVARINWNREAAKAQALACRRQPSEEGSSSPALETVNNA